MACPADYPSNMACPLSPEKFTIPSEPCPLPSLGSDEESFVVLWNDMDSKSIAEVNHEPIGTNVVEEAKQLINKELLEMEQLSLVAAKIKLQTDSNLSVDGPSSENENKMVEATQIDQSTTLPKMPQVENGFDTADVISITTLSTDLTSDQVQKKVSEIVEENIRLKDTILQNNMSMKSQYERILAWQEDVQKVHQAHKEKIIEAKEFIERLKKENYNLTRELEQLKASKIAQEEEIISLRQALKDKERCSQEKLHQTTDDNIREFELDMANKKARELELAMKNLTMENTTLKDDKAKSVVAGSIIEQYEKEIDILRTAVHAGKTELEEAKMELMKVKTLDEEKQKSLNNVIENLRAQLLFTSQQQNMLPSPEEVTNIRQQLATIQVVLTQVEQSRNAAYAQIDSLNTEILELKAKLSGSQTQADEVYALKAQSDLYKADFEAEKSAKETIKIEKVKLLEDMQNLQRRNQQLQEEIEILRDNRDYVVTPSQRSQHSSAPSAPSASAASSSSSNDHPMKCPVCSFGFRSQKTLEAHVYKCLELNDRLP